MHFSELPKQPSILVSYWNVGKLLFGALILFIIETYVFFRLFQNALDNQPLWLVIFWFCCVLFAFVHIFLVLMDVWSRIQNYKRFKDHLFDHGFSPKIADYYKGSKCQRMALYTAAKELGIEDKMQNHFNKSGIKWYHFIPQFMIQDPLFLFRKHFWSRTFLEKYYKPKYQYRTAEKSIPTNVKRHPVKQNL